MEKKLQILYNTLMTVFTSGESTKIMAECLKFTEQLIKEINEEKGNMTEPASCQE